MKYNKNLLHLDLSFTRINSTVVRGLGSCLTRAKSLIVIHFSGNPGVTQDNKDFLF